MNGLPAYPVTRTWIGALLALLVLIIDVVFLVLGMIDTKVGVLIGGLALAVLL